MFLPTRIPAPSANVIHAHAGTPAFCSSAERPRKEVAARTGLSKAPIPRSARSTSEGVSWIIELGRDVSDALDGQDAACGEADAGSGTIAEEDALGGRIRDVEDRVP